MNRFFPNGTNSWNNVISYFNNIPSVDALKNKFFLLFARKNKVIFGIHDPSGLRNLFPVESWVKFVKIS